MVQRLDDGMLQALDRVVEDPTAYVAAWKQRTSRPAIATLPMNFPVELIHASGALPSIVQDNRKPVTVGRSYLPEFYCGYSRNLADQAALGELDGYDGVLLADHCVQLLGAADVIRAVRPKVPLHFAQFTQSIEDPWSAPQVRGKVDVLKAEIELITGAEITADALAHSIRLYNEDRRLVRRLYALRRDGLLAITARQLELIVAAGMVMDVEEHLAVVTAAVDAADAAADAPQDRVRIHVSGHFCHAPRPELLDLIEDCGAAIVDDDLYTGFRFVSADVPEGGDPLDALADWYRDRNVTTPCPTRVQPSVDWDEYLLTSVRASEAAGVVVLMAKFCEPHMLYYPQLRAALEAKGVPVLLIETEHEGVPAEQVRTMVETFVERIRRHGFAAA